MLFSNSGPVLIYNQNGDGKISSSELLAAMKQLGQNPSKAEVDKMIKEVDRDNNGTVEFNEFVELMSARLILRVIL